MMRWTPLLLAAGLLSGCGGLGLGISLGGGGKAADAGSWTHWLCDSKASVQWRFVDAEQSRMDVRLEPDTKVYHLKSEPGAEGKLYSDGVLALHVQGPGGLVYWVATNDLIGRDCKVP